jgi:hypothetical protein
VKLTNIQALSNPKYYLLINVAFHSKIRNVISSPLPTGEGNNILSILITIHVREKINNKRNLKISRFELIAQNDLYPNAFVQSSFKKVKLSLCLTN